MSIVEHARKNGARIAVTLPDGAQSLTFAQIDEQSARLAGALRARGLRPGDRLAVLMDNRPDFFIAAWAARRSGLRLVPVNWHLKLDEAAYVVENADAKALIVSPTLADLGEQVLARTPLVETRLVAGDTPIGQFDSLNKLIAASAPLPEADHAEGVYMFYSSGTTGAPKGILRALPETPFGTLNALEMLQAAIYGFVEGSVYLSPAPLYHAAPLAWSMGAMALGGTVVLMPAFDPEQVLSAIERHKITHAQFVPTHFVRMLRLPDETRARYGLSSMQMAIHAAAPCPVEIKEQMIEWWGPVIHEYYAGSEGGGFTTINTPDWLAHKGSVGRSVLSPVHIVDENGADMPPGEIGLIYFAAGDSFEYHKAPEKTREFFNDKGWGTLGDLGWLDEDGFLFLADRKSHMIISGGVNIYPQEIEAVLLSHPLIADVAVIGVPNQEFGEEVKAVVELRLGAAAGEETTKSIMAFAKEKLANFKLPRTIDYVAALPRLPNGKLMKRELRATYWGDAKRVRI